VVVRVLDGDVAGAVIVGQGGAGVGVDHFLDLRPLDVRLAARQRLGRVDPKQSKRDPGRGRVLGGKGTAGLTSDRLPQKAVILSASEEPSGDVLSGEGSSRRSG
jgi:hypothetical protein